MLLTENWISVFSLVFCCSHWTLHNLWPVRTEQVLQFSLLDSLCLAAIQLHHVSLEEGKKLLNIWHTALAEAFLVLTAAEGLLHAFDKSQFCVNTPVLTFNIFRTARFCGLMFSCESLPAGLLWDLGSPPLTQHSAGQAPIRKPVFKADTLLTSAPLFSFLEILAGWSQFLFFFPGVLSTHPFSLCWRHVGCPSSLRCCFSPHQHLF